MPLSSVNSTSCFNLDITSVSDFPYLTVQLTVTDPQGFTYLEQQFQLIFVKCAEKPLTALEMIRLNGESQEIVAAGSLTVTTIMASLKGQMLGNVFYEITGTQVVNGTPHHLKLTTLILVRDGDREIMEMSARKRLMTDLQKMLKPSESIDPSIADNENLANYLAQWEAVLDKNTLDGDKKLIMFLDLWEELQHYEAYRQSA